MIRKKNPVGTRKKRIFRLSLKFIGTVIPAAVISALPFGFLFFSRYRMPHLAVGEEAAKKEAGEQTQALQDTITKEDISKKNKKAIRREMRKCKNLTLYLYDDEGTLSETSFSMMEDQTYVDTTSFQLNLCGPNDREYTLKFHDGEAYLVVYPFVSFSFMTRLLIVATVASILLFIVVIMQFIHHKMKYVSSTEGEIQLTEAGDFYHVTIYRGSDESMDLARQLNHLHNALYSNMLKGEEARSTNQELATAVSHDLHTPLTPLLGYLDILQMKTYKSNAARDNYTRKSRQKAGQIKGMSDKLFNHFPVYSHDEKLQPHPIEGQAALSMLEFCCEKLCEQKFGILTKFERGSWEIMGGEVVLMRVLDSVFSNIRKHGNEHIVTVSLQAEKGNVLI